MRVGTGFGVGGTQVGRMDVHTYDTKSFGLLGRTRVVIHLGILRTREYHTSKACTRPSYIRSPPGLA
jgi:hypothetical protein